MPPEWGVGRWVLWRLCLIIFFYRKFQPKKIISLCIPPVPNTLNQGAMVPIQHPVCAPLLIPELLQLFKPGTWSILQVFTFTLNRSQPCSWWSVHVVWGGTLKLQITIWNYIVQKSSLENVESVLELWMGASRSPLWSLATDDFGWVNDSFWQFFYIRQWWFLQPLQFYLSCMWRF